MRVSVLAMPAPAHTLEPCFPHDLEWARGALLRRAPAWSRTSEITGLAFSCPHEAVHAITILEESVRNGMPLPPSDEALIESALGHYGVVLTQHCYWRLPTLLGARSERHLAPLLALHAIEEGVREALRNLDALSFETLHLAVKSKSASAEWIRHAQGLNPAFVPSLHALDEPLALHVETLADGQLDVGQLRDAWQCTRSRLPVWNAPSITIAGAMPRDGPLAFLTGNQTREFEEAIQIQLFPPDDARENTAAGLWSIATLNARKRLLLLRDPETHGCQLAASPIDLRNAVREATLSECMLVLPRVRQLLTHLGSVTVDIDGERPHRMAMRVGGLRRVLLDRPFLVVDWNVEHEEAVGAGLLIAGALKSVLY